MCNNPIHSLPCSLVYEYSNMKRNWSQIPDIASTNMRAFPWVQKGIWHPARMMETAGLKYKSKIQVKVSMRVSVVKPFFTVEHTVQHSKYTHEWDFWNIWTFYNFSQYRAALRNAYMQFERKISMFMKRLVKSWRKSYWKGFLFYQNAELPYLKFLKGCFEIFLLLLGQNWLFWDPLCQKDS